MYKMVKTNNISPHKGVTVSRRAKDRGNLWQHEGENVFFLQLVRQLEYVPFLFHKMSVCMRNTLYFVFKDTKYMLHLCTIMFLIVPNC